MTDKGCYLAIYFPQDEPYKWCWGKPLETRGGGGRLKEDEFWVNFTAEGEEPKRQDDVKTKASILTNDNYKTEWAVVAPKAVLLGSLSEEPQA